MEKFDINLKEELNIKNECQLDNDFELIDNQIEYTKSIGMDWTNVGQAYSFSTSTHPVNSQIEDVPIFKEEVQMKLKAFSCSVCNFINKVEQINLPSVGIEEDGTTTRILKFKLVERNFYWKNIPSVNLGQTPTKIFACEKCVQTERSNNSRNTQQRNSTVPALTNTIYNKNSNPSSNNNSANNQQYTSNTTYNYSGQRQF